MKENEKSKQSLILKEYGKNIQKLVDYVTTVPDKAKRTEYAFALVELMKQLNPLLKTENDQKLWDDLYIMSNFELDIEAPFPMPEKELLGKKPQKLGYPQTEVRFKHYGRNIEKLIEKAIEIEDDEEQEVALIYIGQLMRSFHSTWNRENFDDAIIIDDIKILSKGKLHIDLEKVKENGLFETSMRRDFKHASPSSNDQNTSSGRRNYSNNSKRRNNGGNKKRRN
jgi:predicted secreted protein